MHAGPTYRKDTEFKKLLARRSDIDLTVAALELSRDAYPELDFQPTLDWIASRGRELSATVARAKSEREALSEVAGCIAQTHGIFGTKEAYERAESSYVQRVIATKRGIPISLTVLYMAVAKSVGLELSGVSAPLHFLARYESVNGPLFVDAFSQGRILGAQECVRWLREISGLPKQKIKPALKPAQPRTIVIRMLNNLKALYAGKEEWSAAWLVQHRLSTLQPAAYHERRDLAVISLKSDRAGQAVDLLQSCLRNCPDDEKQVLETHLDAAKRRLARWN